MTKKKIHIILHEPRCADKKFIGGLQNLKPERRTFLTMFEALGHRKEYFRKAVCRATQSGTLRNTQIDFNTGAMDLCLKDDLVRIRNSQHRIDKTESLRAIKAVAEVLVHDGYGSRQAEIKSAFIKCYTTKLDVAILEDKPPKHDRATQNKHGIKNVGCAPLSSSYMAAVARAMKPKQATRTTVTGTERFR